MPHVLFLTFVLGAPIDSCNDPETFSGYDGKPVENISKYIYPDDVYYIHKKV